MALVSSRRNASIILGILAAAAIVLGYAAAATWEPRLIPGRGPRVVEIHGSWPFDFREKRQVVGISTNVFIGRVVAQTGSAGLPTSKPGTRVPFTQFSVEVLHNIKGSLTGQVTVDQMGGYDNEELVVPEGDQLLEPGQVYLLATEYLPDRGWYRVVAPGYADLPIADAAQRAQLIREFEAAYRNEIPYDRERRRFVEPQP